METKILDILFLVLVVIMVILFVAIVVIGAFEKEERGLGGLKDVTGAIQSFEVYHETLDTPYKIIKTTEKYDDKYFEYLEHIQEQRDKTFMKGKVFLVEKTK